MNQNNQTEILLVEDNPDDLDMTLYVLGKTMGAKHVHIARDGQEALDFLFRRGSYATRTAETDPKVIFLDLKLPKVDGLDVLKAIRADDRTATIPIVILTSSKEQRDLLRSYQSGANAFIQKPVDFAQFQLAIKEIGLFWLVVNEPPPNSAML